jgi:preprotein translocase subunit YajC
VTFIPLLLVFVIFYFLIILPQRKRQRALDAMLDNLKSGDKVVTSGGIYGTIVSVRDDKRTVQLKISENPVIRVEVARTAISGMQDAPVEEKK